MSVTPSGPPHPVPAPPGQPGQPGAGPTLPGQPGVGHTPPGGAAPTTPGRGGAGRWILVGVLGVVMLLLTGLGGYFGGRSYQGSRASQSCDGYDCIPRLEAEKVVKALQDKGHNCRADRNHRSCELHIGMVGFDVSLQVADGLIHAIEVQIFRAGDYPITEFGMAYLNWFATLPYARDEQTSAEIRQWLAEQVNGNKETEATIGDYSYKLTRPDRGKILLYIEGKA